MRPENNNFTASTPAKTVEDQLQRIEELGQMLLAYNDVTERLEQSHARLTQRVEQLQVELSEKNRQLARKQRLAALGEMAAGLAHEIRNPLGAIQLFAGILKQDLRDMPEPLQVVQRITQSVNRLEGLVSQVLQFTRELRVNCSPCDLAFAVEDAIDMAKMKAGSRVEIRAQIGRGVRVNADANLIQQAVLNLLHNSIEAIEQQGVVEVAMGQNDDVLELWIKDTGPGIAADILEQIFHPFFTTKDHGTGLGLAIVHRVIEAHDGTISAQSGEGGATFVVRLPVASISEDRT
jgi:signal transduction histidine kinase